MLRDLSAYRVRTSPAFRLVKHNSLSEPEQTALSTLTQDPDHYGVLVPRTSTSLGVLAVDNSTASMLKAQTTASVLPACVLAQVPNVNQSIARLVVDGIFEIEHTGRFFSGPSAHSLIFNTPWQQPSSEHVLASLSHRALRSAQSLTIDEPARMAAWLYACNSVPLNPHWARLFLNAARIEKTLGFNGCGEVSALLDAHYRCTQLPHWTAWERRPGTSGFEPVDSTRPNYKLYVSIHPASLIDVFSEIMRRIAESGVAAFKLGNDVHGVLRPDKLMLYFSDFESLEATAKLLQGALAGSRAQGVPFTAPIDDEGVLSWGLDPPSTERIAGWSGGESWRAWVVNRLARAVVRARAMGDDSTAWLCALDRMRLEGINVDQWLPDRVHWNTAGDT